MPLYLCQSGAGHVDPWRQGLQVYAAPHGDGGSAAAAAAGDGNTTVAARSDTMDDSTGSVSGGAVIRRVRHAEVVLVDDICISHGKYWLRLRWPGKKGGFAGYISVQDIIDSRRSSSNIGTVLPPVPKSSPDENEDEEEEDDDDDEEEDDEEFKEVGDDDNLALQEKPSSERKTQAVSASGLTMILEDSGVGFSDDNDNLAGGAATPSADPSAAESSAATVSCLRTGLPFLSSQAMNLMPLYDDGLSPPVALATNITTEPVFCRICREGLHDDADDEQPTPAADNDDAEDGNNSNAVASAGNNNRAADAFSSRQSSANLDDFEEEVIQPSGGNLEIRTETDAAVADQQEEQQSIRATAVAQKGPVFPHPNYTPNPHAMENPLLAPCECSGSMAFVHYLCVEQWRCRSRHPDAQNGLSCETCGSPYSLPPPSSRPANVQAMEQAEDWLDAMPPHVMQALRQPHVLWQIGAAVVRRRWLRPLAPVVMSPIVALYCRARRLLKKRGVARRRWACSLCRRRARWKCVRCLRSYYCSRQCQNVSWHIVHKHVCYKPSRMWWSTVFYGSLCLFIFPGILRDPLMYDLGLFLLPLSFICIGIIAGGIATTLKKSFAVDMRGRMLELTVVLGSMWLSAVSWGLVRGFFGQVDACHGSLGRRFVITQPEDFSVGDGIAGKSFVLFWLRRLILTPAQLYYTWWDDLVSSSGPWVVSVLCVPRAENNTGCFEYLPFANANFFIPSNADHSEEELLPASKCAADLLLVWYLYLGSVVAYLGSVAYKFRERRARIRQPRGLPRNQPRPHQD